MFNSLKYAKILDDAGLPRNQAVKHIQIISEVLEKELASKQNFISLESKFTNLEGKFESFEIRIEDKIENLENRLIIKIGSLMVILFGSAIGVASLVL